MMSWGGTPFDPLGPDTAGPENYEVIELVGPHLRVSGSVSLLRFTRLSDLVNHNQGFFRLSNALLLRRNGDPTGTVIEELMVNQDGVTFLAQKAEHLSSEATALPGGMDRPLMERMPRKLAIFTEGHTITGTVYLFGETDIMTFVDTPDPRFIPMIDATARSLADRRVISHFALVLVNRTAIMAASLLEKAGGAEETGVEAE